MAELNSMVSTLAATVATDQMLQRTTVGAGDRFSNKPRNRTFQASITGTGAVSATVKIEVSNEVPGANQQWLTLMTLSPSGTNMATDGAPSETAWTHVRANLTAISGTSAVVTVTMGSGTDV